MSWFIHEREPSARHHHHRHIAQAIGRSYFESERIYGYRKVHQDLLEANIVCCKETVRRIMREIGFVLQKTGPICRGFSTIVEDRGQLTDKLDSRYWIIDIRRSCPTFSFRKQAWGQGSLVVRS